MFLMRSSNCRRCQWLPLAESLMLGPCFLAFARCKASTLLGKKYRTYGLRFLRLGSNRKPVQRNWGCHQFEFRIPAKLTRFWELHHQYCLWAVRELKARREWMSWVLLLELHGRLLRKGRAFPGCCKWWMNVRRQWLGKGCPRAQPKLLPNDRRILIPRFR